MGILLVNRMAANTAIVIGAGIAGCSTAYALAQRGIHVRLLERNGQIADEASGNPVAMLYPRLSGNAISSEFALKAYLHSLQFYESLRLSEADFSCCGMLQLGFNAKELERIRQVAAHGHASTIAEYVNAHEASAITGFEIDHDAIHLPEAGWINPRQLCKRLTVHPNIHVYTNENVIHLSKDQALFRVRTQRNTVLNADIVVIANANDARALCTDLNISTQAVRGQVTLLKASEKSRRLQKVVCSDGYFSPAVLHEGKESLHCLGATFSNLPADECLETVLAVSAEDHKANMKKLGHISSTLSESFEHHIVSGRVSLRCTAMDFWPLAGQLLDAVAIRNQPPRPGADVSSLPWIDGLYMNIAHGSKGFITAPLCAEMIACMASHESLPISGAIAGFLNPNRFLLKAMGLKRLAKTVLG